MNCTYRPLLFVLFALCCLATWGQSATSSSTAVAPHGEVQARTFYSKALQRTIPYEVVLPVNYSSSHERYPVLYLLHGWMGDETNYVKLTSLLDVVSSYKLIVVLPRGENSWYVNSATSPANRFSDYLFSDLPTEIDAQLRTVAVPSARAIAGLSMGGYGAVLLSLEHPGSYGFVASLSGAFAGPSGIETVMPVLKPSTDAAFGASDSATRRNNDLDTLVQSDDPAGQPYFFLACGSADPLLESSRHLVQQLSARKYAYEYHELPGAHTWKFWSNELEPMLAVLSRQMRVARLVPVSSQPAAVIDTH